MFARVGRIMERLESGLRIHYMTSRPSQVNGRHSPRSSAVIPKRAALRAGTLNRRSRWLPQRPASPPPSLPLPPNCWSAVERSKRQSGKGLFVGGVRLPLALAELGLIDEYEFVVHPTLVGHGPTLFAGLSKRVDLKLVSRLEFGSGAVAMRYEPRR